MKKIISVLIISISFFSTGFSQGLKEVNPNSEKNELYFENIIGQFQGSTFAYSNKKNMLVMSSFSNDNAKPTSNAVVKFVTSENTRITFLTAVMTVNGPVVIGYTHSKEVQKFYALLLNSECTPVGEAVTILKAKTIEKPLRQNLIIKTDLKHTKIIVSYFRHASKQKNYSIDVAILNPELKQLLHSQPLIPVEATKKGAPYVDFQVYLDTDINGYFATVESAIIANDREFDHKVMINYYDESGKIAITNLVETRNANLFKPIMTPSETEGNIKITGFYKPEGNMLIEDYYGVYTTEYQLRSLEQHQSIQAPFKTGFVKYNFPTATENVKGKLLVPLNYSINNIESTTQGITLIYIQEQQRTVNKKAGEETVLLGNLVILALHKTGVIAWSQLVPFSHKITVKSNSKFISYTDAKLAGWGFVSKVSDKEISILYKKPTKQLEDGSFMYQTLWQSFYLEDGKLDQSKEDGFYDKNEQLVYLTMYNRLISRNR